MITIIEDLEAISQLETGELQLEIERFDLGAMMKDVIDAQEMKATEKGIMLTMPKESKPLFVVGDRFRIRQVIVNLIVNSVKYGKEYGETKIRFYDVGDTVLIEIADNGIGISPEYKNKVFEKFFRVPLGDTHNTKGYGLGLSYVSHVIQRHKGKIEVESQPGLGSEFIITLPKTTT